MNPARWVRAGWEKSGITRNEPAGDRLPRAAMACFAACGICAFTAIYAGGLWLAPAAGLLIAGFAALVIEGHYRA